MNKRNLSYTAAILFIFLLMVPGIAAADICIDGYHNVSVCKAANMIEKDNVFILDVRTPTEFSAGHIEGAALVPVKERIDGILVPIPKEIFLEEVEANNIDKCQKILVYCKSGGRSSLACSILVDAGYKKVYNMEGGIDAWIAQKYPVV